MKKHIESLLFVAKEPLKLEAISELIDVDDAVTLRWMFELQQEYRERGIVIHQIAGGFEMVTAPDCFSIVEKIIPKEIETLSRSAFETVAAIAYHQPLTRSQVAKIRGVSNPDYGINILLEKKLIKEEKNGLYITTDEFLKYFGINDLKELPGELPLKREGPHHSLTEIHANSEDFSNDNDIESNIL